MKNFFKLLFFIAGLLLSPFFVEKKVFADVIVLQPNSEIRVYDPSGGRTYREGERVPAKNGLRVTISSKLLVWTTGETVHTDVITRRFYASSGLTSCMSQKDDTPAWTNKNITSTQSMQTLNPFPQDWVFTLDAASCANSTTATQLTVVTTFFGNRTNVMPLEQLTREDKKSITIEKSTESSSEDEEDEEDEGGNTGDTGGTGSGGNNGNDEGGDGSGSSDTILTGYGDGSYDVECVATGVANYINNTVGAIDKGRYSKIKFLSPAFNMTEANFGALVASIKSKTGANWGKLDGVAGNAYNTFWWPLIAGADPNPGDPGGRIREWVNAAYADGSFAGKDLMLTEIGWHELINPGNGWAPSKDTAKSRLKEEISGLKGDSKIIGAALFNAFNTNTGWSDYYMLDDDIKYVCGNDCQKVGVNSAAGLGDDGFNAHANALGMKISAGIISSDANAIASAANNALSKGVTPVLRIGVGNDSDGFNRPDNFISFINDLNSKLNGTVYIIAGPNEPNAEGWADPNGPGTCARDGTNNAGGNITISGEAFSSNIETNAKNAKVLNRPIYGAVAVAYYMYTDLTAMRTNGGNKIKVIETTSTFENGYYELHIPKNTGPNNMAYIAFLCGSQIKGRVLIDTSRDYRGLAAPLACDTQQTPVFNQSLLDQTKSGFLSCERNSVVESPGLLAQAQQTLSKFLGMEGSDNTYRGATYNAAANNGQLPENRSQQSREVQQGRLGIKNAKYDPRDIASFFITVLGYYTNIYKLPLQGDDTPAELPSCENIKNANNTLGSVNTHLSSSVGLSLSSPGFTEDLYEAASCKDDAAFGCKNPDGSTLTLRGMHDAGIDCPWCYLTCSSSKSPQISMNIDSEDNLQNVEDACRDSDASIGTNLGRKTAKSCYDVILPKKDILNIFNAQKAVTSDPSGQYENPACVFNSPGTPCGYEEGKGLDPDVNLPRVGRGYYWLGETENFCVCSTADPNCQKPVNTADIRDETKDPYSSGYSLATEASDKHNKQRDRTTFLGVGLDRSTVNFFTNFFDNLRAIFDVTYSTFKPEKGAACTDETRVPSAACDPDTNTNCYVEIDYGNPDTNECDMEDADMCDPGYRECVPEQIKCNYFKYTYDKYGCTGKVDYDLKTNTGVTDTGREGGKDSWEAGILEAAYLPFASPFDETCSKSTGTKVFVDVKASDEKEPGKNQGYDQDMNASSVSGSYINGCARMLVRDPVFAKKGTQLSIGNVEVGRNDIGTDADVSCGKDGSIDYTSTGNAIADRAVAIVRNLQEGFWCYWNKSPDYKSLFDEALYTAHPRHCVYEAGYPPGCTGDYKKTINLFWCTWLVIKSYAEAGNGFRPQSLGAQSMADEFKAVGKFLPDNANVKGRVSPGDVIFSYVGNKTRIGHVGVVIEVGVDYIKSADANSALKTHAFTIGTNGKVQSVTENYRFAGIGKQ